jgi:hypothetical protein
VNAQEIKDIVSLLMLIPLGIVLGTGIFFIFMAVRWVRRRHAAQPEEKTRPAEEAVQRPPFRPALYAQPSRWLAIRGSNPRAVQEALGLHHTTPCSWEEGLVEAQDHKLFVSPSVAGWILVIGSNLPEPEDDVDKLYHFLMRVSRKLGHVQYFHVNRACNHHAWVMVEQGRVFRAYACAGEILWNQGQVTGAERQLALRCFDYGMTIDFSERDILQANTEKLSLLASRWSVDPNSIDESQLKTDQGIAGELSPSTFQ